MSSGKHRQRNGSRAAPRGLRAVPLHARSAFVSFVIGLFLPHPALAVDASVWAELAKTTSLQAEFDQLQYRKILKVPLHSTGTVSFSRPDRLTWSTRAPSPSTFSLDRGVARMTVPDLGIDETIDLAQMPEANQVATSMMVWLTADATAVQRDFSTAYTEIEAVLTPKDARLRALIAEIRLVVAASPTRVREVWLTEPDGDRIAIRLARVVLDGRAVPDVP